MNSPQGTRRNTYKGSIGWCGHAERVHQESVQSGVLGKMSMFRLEFLPHEKAVADSVLARFA